jgi:uncharacterized circularly permuted ATP-grasp superfamily protein
MDWVGSIDPDTGLPNVVYSIYAYELPPREYYRRQDILDKLVVKTANGSGGYGMLVGPAATKAEIEAFRERLEADPANYIACQY